MATALPEYVRASVPNPPNNRQPWYKNTAPSYAGIFLWVGFCLQLAEGTINQMGIGLAIVALIVAGLLCFALYYYAPAMLGMQTGLPVVHRRHFHLRCARWLPGAGSADGPVAAWLVCRRDLRVHGFHHEGPAPDVRDSIYRGCSAVGLRPRVRRDQRDFTRGPSGEVSELGTAIVAIATIDGLSNFRPAEDHPGRGFANVLEIVIGFFAAAGAAGADFGMNNRGRQDIVRGGLVVYSALAKTGLRPPVIPEYQLTPPVSQSAAKVP
jgi:cytosine permease